MNLVDKRVLVIGGTSGIGLAVAAGAAERGARVTVASSSPGKVTAARKLLPDSVDARELDVTDEAAVVAFAAAIGTLDHLVYTAGDGLLVKWVADATVGEAREFFDIRFWGAYTVVKHLAPQLSACGSIVLTSGGVAQRPAPGLAVAASATSAVEGLTRALAVELAPVRVNAVRPGVLRTPLWTHSGLTSSDDDEFFERAGEGLPVGRIGTAEEAAAAYLFLLENGFATGTTVSVDGGQLLV
ncbi:NAD(P)-dependent dehydrogenase (short-subunit alcohol dehydrogenase family) [Nocardia sp. GAS34]|uniref:SDR family oxidoreductase n=1 Tax=unclassified Nocardia TaxID=2637762 RepID=UPI003D25BB02